jgi:K+-sensing histidine kinase KdpD
MRPSPSGFPLLMSVSLAAPLLVCALLYPARSSVSDANTVLLLVIVVVGVGVAGRRTAGVVAALSSAVWFDFFLTEPYLRFTISDRNDVETAVLLTLVGVAVTEIAGWGIRQRTRASGREGYLDGLAEAASMAADSDVPAGALREFIGRQVVAVLGADSCTFRTGPPTSRPRLERDGSVTLDGRVLDVDRSGLPTGDVIELPVHTGGQVRGTFVISCATRAAWPSLQQRRVAVTLAEQAAVALARPA